MSLRKILEVPHPVLKKVAKPVDTIDDDLQSLLDDMLETMYEAPGIGLAAPQVGVEKRIVVLDVSGEGERDPHFLINPEITWTSSEKVIAEEGCLSLPQQFADVKRPRAVKVSYLDRGGEPTAIEADDLLARCLQHEIDHLNGILFIDHISSLKRKMLLRKLNKQRRQKDD